MRGKAIARQRYADFFVDLISVLSVQEGNLWFSR